MFEGLKVRPNMQEEGEAQPLYTVVKEVICLVFNTSSAFHATRCHRRVLAWQGLLFEERVDRHMALHEG